MFIADMPNTPPSTPAIVVVAQANATQQIAAQRENVLGVCDVVYSGQADLIPGISASNYFKINGVSTNFLDFVSTAKVSVVKQPAHGSLDPDSRGDWRGAKYLPSDDYLGEDSFILEVQGNGYTVRLHYFMFVTNMVRGVTNPNPVCKGEQARSYWKISLNANVNSMFTVVHYQPNLRSSGLASAALAA